MKKKILIAMILSFVLLTGVVSAATNWGKFEGNNIVRLLINGKEANVKDVPAVMLNNRTMVPIYMLKDAGLDISWDGKNSTVSVENKSVVTEDEFIEMNKVIQTHRAFITFMDQIELTSISRDLSLLVSNEDEFNQAMKTVNRIDVDALYSWSDILYYLGVSENTQFYSVAESIAKAKNSLLEGDMKLSYTHYINAKTTMNKIYPQMDAKVESTFSITNKELYK